MEQRDEDDEKGGTMRPGSYPCRVEPGSQIADIYGGEREINERHRHRFEVNVGIIVSGLKMPACGFGMSPDKRPPEIVELRDHPWYMVSNSTRS